MIPSIIQPDAMPSWDDQCAVKNIPVAMTRAALDGDLDALTELMPEGWLDAVNALGTAVLMLAAVIRAQVGNDPEAHAKILDTCREVIQRGRGL
ncbi:hypothetical protein [Geodermatophilus sp. SYSU D01105]